MSIETEFESTITNVKNAYQGLDNLGATIPQNKTIENIKSCLDEIYNKFPKTDYAEGTEITLSNTLKGKLDFEKIYQEVEYISGTGTQYINTGVLGGLNKKVIIKCSVKSIADYTLYGSRQSTGNTVSYVSISSATSSWQSALGSNWLRAENNSFVVDEICTIESYLSSGEQYIKKNGTIIYSGNRKVSLETFTQNDYLLAFNNQGSVSQIANANLYDCKVYQNNVLIRYFIPCYRKIDNVIGLYDKVEGKFYTNAGTGTFTKGADVGSGFGDKVGYGDTKQDSTKGYQLWNITDGTYSNSGITAVVKNGEITLNGTASATAFVNIPLSTNITWQSNTNYTIYGFNPIENTNIRIRINGSGGLDVGLDSANRVKTVLYNVTDGQTYNFTLRVQSGQVLNNFILKPMLIIGSDTTKAYEPYTNGASPNPNYPQPIEVVRGKNLFDGTKNNSTKINTSGNIYASGGSATTNLINVNPNTTYTISGITVERIAFYDSASTFIEKQDNISTFTTTSTTKYIRFQGALSSLTDWDYAMLEQGSQATAYLPYNTVEIEERGKNYFNNNISRTYTNNCSETTLRTGKRVIFSGSSVITGATFITYAVMDLSNYVGSTIRLKANFTPSASNLGRFYIGLCDSNGTNRTSKMTVSTSGNTASFKVPELTETQTYLCVTLYANIGDVTVNPGDYVDYTDMMLTIDDEDMTYELYQEPKTYQLSLGDKELYENSEISYENGNWYFNDNMQKITLDGTETWGLSGNGNYFYNTNNKYPRSASGSTMVNSYCTHYVKDIFNHIYNGTPDYAFGFAYSNNSLAIRNKDIKTVQAFKTLLTTNNVEIVCPTNETIKTPITDTTLIEQLNNWYNSQSFTGTTIITSNGELPLVLKVRALKG